MNSNGRDGHVFVLYTTFNFNPFSNALGLRPAVVSRHPPANVPEGGGGGGGGVQEEEKEKEAEKPEIVSECFLDVVKGALFNIVGKAVRKIQEEECEGCDVTHPSQRRHTCLYPAPKNFFFNKFKQLMELIWCPDLLPTLMKVLEQHGVTAEERRVKGIVEGLLYDLREVEFIQDHIAEGGRSLELEGNFKPSLIEQAMSDFTFPYDETDERNNIVEVEV